MFDFRLKVFHTVARRLSFTKAAAELFISQPAVTKHIHEIESFYKTKLFARNGTKITLTAAGEVLLKHAEELFAIYRNIDFDLAAINENIKGTIRLGASTTVSQYVLPKGLAGFKRKFPDIHVELSTNNTEHIERMLAENSIDLGIIEGQSKRKLVKYVPLAKDEMVLCTRTDNPLAKKNIINVSELKKLPLVIREQGSGSLEVVNEALKKAGIKTSQLNIEMVMENSESIKTYLLSSNAFALLSIYAVLKELKNNELKIVDIKNMNIERHFYFIAQQGDNLPLQKLFIKYLSSYNFKL